MEFLPISDPDTRTDLLNNGDLQASQMFTPDGPFCAPDVVQAGDDPAAAAPLVADYCADAPEECSGGKIDIELQWFGPAVITTRTAEILDQGWGGHFNVAFDELAQDTHNQEIALGQYDAAIWRHRRTRCPYRRSAGDDQRRTTC